MSPDVTRTLALQVATPTNELHGQVHHHQFLNIRPTADWLDVRNRVEILILRYTLAIYID